jgi:hypothetical protein
MSLSSSRAAAKTASHNCLASALAVGNRGASMQKVAADSTWPWLRKLPVTIRITSLRLASVRSLISRLTVATSALLEASSETRISLAAAFDPVLSESMDGTARSRADPFRCGYQSAKSATSIAPSVGTVQPRLPPPRKTAAHRTVQTDAARTKTHITQKRFPLSGPSPRRHALSKMNVITIAASMHVPMLRIPTCDGPEWPTAARTGFGNVKFLTNSLCCNSLCCPRGGS